MAKVKGTDVFFWSTVGAIVVTFFLSLNASHHIEEEKAKASQEFEKDLALPAIPGE